MNKYIVEFLGTLFFAFIIFATGNWLAIGAALAIVVLLGGGYYNPVMAIASVVDGKVKNNEIIPIIVSEIAGALAGYELYKLILK